MVNSLHTVISGVGALAGMGALASVASVRARHDRRHRPGVYAARDDTAIDPIARPMRAGCAALEVAVWLDGYERLQVGARRWDHDAGNTLRRLVLDPLARRAARLGGRVHRGQRSPVLLMVEIVEADPGRQARAYDVLDAELRNYPELLTYTCDGIVIRRAVTVVVTGPAAPRHRLVAQADRYAFCDGNFGDVGAWGAPAALVPVVSEHWAWHFGWDGVEEMPAPERHLLRDIVATAQADGRQVRFFGIPERRARVRDAYWRELFGCGVDLVTTADPRALARFLKNGGISRPLPMPSLPVSPALASAPPTTPASAAVAPVAPAVATAPFLPEASASIAAQTSASSATQVRPETPALTAASATRTPAAQTPATPATPAPATPAAQTSATPAAQTSTTPATPVCAQAPLPAPTPPGAPGTDLPAGDEVLSVAGAR